MRHRWLWSVAILCLLLWGTKAIHHAMQPKYQGKTAEEWFAQINIYNPPSTNSTVQIVELDPGIQAFKHFGPDAARFVWKELNVQDSLFKTWLIEQVQRWSDGRWVIESSDVRNIKAHVCLDQMGAQADCLMPEIITQAINKDYGALQLIGKIGTRTEQTVPLLVTSLSDSDPWIVNASLFSLERIGPAATNALPALARFLPLKSGEDRLQIAATMVAIGDASKLSILISEAQNPVSTYQTNALYLLGGLEGKALAAVPALLQVTTDSGSSPVIRSLVLKTIDRIAPGRAQANGLLPSMLPD